MDLFYIGLGKFLDIKNDMFENMINPQFETWMIVPLIVFLIGYLKLCVYFENKNKL